MKKLPLSANQENQLEPFKAAEGEPNSLPGLLEQAFNQIGSSMMSLDFASKLLAYVYVYGGGNEVVTLHTGLNAGIKIAQQKLNIYGGCIPKNTELLKQYISELEQKYCSSEIELVTKVPWVLEIYDRYELKFKK